MGKPKVHQLIVATLELGGMPTIKANQAAKILSRYLRLKSLPKPTNSKERGEDEAKN